MAMEEFKVGNLYTSKEGTIYRYDSQFNSIVGFFIRVADNQMTLTHYNHLHPFHPNNNGDATFFLLDKK